MISLLAAALASASGRPTPLTLDDALAEAAHTNGALRAARSAAELAKVDVRSAYAGVLPRLDLTSGVGHSFVGRSSREVTYPATVDLDTGQIVYGKRRIPVSATDDPAYSLSLAAKWTLFDGDRNWKALKRARAVSRGAEHLFDEAKLRTAFTVTRQFMEVVKAEENVRVLSETAGRSRDILTRAETLFRGGRSSRLDILTAQANLNSDLISVAQARASRSQARADLAVSLGRTDASHLEVVRPASLSEPIDSSAREPASILELLNLARDRRSLLLAEAENLRSAELGIGIAHGAWSPVLSVQATYDKQGTVFSGRDGVFAQPARWYTANAEFVLEWNLFDGGRSLADEQRAALANEQARQRAEAVDQQVAAEIAKARASIISQLEIMDIAESSLAVAGQALEMTRERLASGAATQIEVRDASVKLTQAQLALANARVDYIIARSDLNRAVGGGL